MRTVRGCGAAIALLVGAGTSLAAQRVDVVVGRGVGSTPITGRAFVIFTRDNSREPRLQAGSYAGGVPFFGVDVSELEAGQPAVIDAATLGFPTKSLRDIPAGSYFVQGLMVVYTKVTPKHGKTIWVPWDQWEGRQWNRTPGNLVSDVQSVTWDPNGSHLTMTLTKVLPPVETLADTRWVKRIKIQSPLLSAWWGKPVYLGATVLLPKGWEDNPTTRYPAIYIQGHFGEGAPFGFNPDGKPETAEARSARTVRSAREPGYEFAQSWSSPAFPKMVAITFQHPTPYYDDSYAVNSANTGPYQDALIQELIPYLEEKFRLIPKSYARLLTGGSTGGWEALALQIQQPKFFGGTWSLYPDGVDFSRNQMIDNYADTNAFMPNAGPNQWLMHDRFLSRAEDGQPQTTVRQMAQLERVLGSRVRGGQQLEAYDATYGPVGDDGYPKPLFDRVTGTIDKSVAAYWRDNGYDLNHYLKQNWSRIGKDLNGKITVWVGDMDNYFLNLGVYKMEETFKALKGQATFQYGRPMKPHGWQPVTNAEMVRQMARHVAKRASVEGR
ncbi:MAG: enterochelin esterase-like enzyme [Gemmatimonadetes bacterium]|nr:enterochelin esterase-like enzyme [Gemmatimonadota bacterium]